MKLEALLVNFFNEYHRLDLPGLGSFVRNENSQNQSESILFTCNKSLSESPELIKYLSEQTGKMKSLADADLASHISSIIQFLNIGRLYYIEGLGTLSKAKGGLYEFSEGMPPQEFLFQDSAAHTPTNPRAHIYSGEYSEVLQPKKTKFTFSKNLVGLIFLAILALAFWGVYALLNNSKESKEQSAPTPEAAPSESATTPSNNLNAPDNSNVPAQQIVDTTASNPSTAVVTALASTQNNNGTFRFVIETAGKERALKRWKMLRDYDLDVRLYTKDSTEFEIYFVLPATPKDTARVMDSLAVKYTPKGKRAFASPLK